MEENSTTDIKSKSHDLADGTILYTKDGIKIGNSIIVGHSDKSFTILTDYGEIRYMSSKKIYTLFTPESLIEDKQERQIKEVRKQLLPHKHNKYIGKAIYQKARQESDNEPDKWICSICGYKHILTNANDRIEMMENCPKCHKQIIELQS